MLHTPASLGPVYCFGHITTGRILRLRDAYPRANGYAEVLETADNYCGEATAAALILQRFGVPTILEGNWLGDDATGRRTHEFLTRRGIDGSGLCLKSGYPGVTEVVVTDAQTRTVFGRFVDLLTTTPQWEPPRLAQLARARCVCLDPGFGATSLAVARAAVEHGIPFVSSDTPLESELTTRAAVTVISQEWLSAQPGMADPREALACYGAACPGLVVLTQGAGPVWWSRGGRTGECPAHRIEPVDTAGAGDSFRAAMVYALLAGWDDARAVRFAVAVAAMVCLSFPGVVNSPTLEEVERWMHAHPLADQ